MSFPVQLAALDTGIIVIIGIVFLISKAIGFIRNLQIGTGTPPRLTGTPPVPTGGSIVEVFLRRMEQQIEQSQLPPILEVETVPTPHILSKVYQKQPPVPQVSVRKPVKTARAASGQMPAVRLDEADAEVAADVAVVVKMLRNPITARQAVIASVILGRPVSETP